MKRESIVVAATNPWSVQQPCGQFGHGDGPLGLDRLDQEALIGHQLAASGGRPCRACSGEPMAPLPLHQLDGETLA